MRINFKRLKVEKASFSTLAEILEKTRNAELLKKVNDKTLHHQHKTKKLGYMYAIILSLDFLGAEDNLTNLLLVNQSWNRLLKKRVYEKILSSLSFDEIGMKKRINAYQTLLEIVIYSLSFHKII